MQRVPNPSDTVRQFLPLYDQLLEHELSYLEIVCLHRGEFRCFSSEPQLQHLRELELIDFSHSNGWIPTWLGRGVLNWHKQIREAVARKLRVPKPRLGENGALPGPPCDEFRPLLFSGIYCWCGRLRSEHAGEAVLTAIDILDYHLRNQIMGPLRHRISGRTFEQLEVLLPSELKPTLQLVSRQGVSIHDLHLAFEGDIRLMAIQASLDFLARLDLIYHDEAELLWYPSWEGTGLKYWLQERFIHEGLNQEMPEVKLGENGDTAGHRPCDHFRPLLSRGGHFCWCGHPDENHLQVTE